MASNPPVPPAAPPPPPKKRTSPIVWILVGIGGFFVLIVLVVIAGIVYVARNPTAVMTKMITAANPNVEVLSVNKGSQEITLRDKQTGKTYNISFDDVKNGRITMKEDGKPAVTISGGGASGTVEMKSADGTVKIGGKAKVPTWVPDYPGSDPQGAFQSTTNEGDSGTFTFKTKDASDKVVKFYQDQFQSLGLKVTSNVTSQNGQSSAGMLQAQDEANKHTVTVVIGTEGSETSVGVTYQTGK